MVSCDDEWIQQQFSSMGVYLFFSFVFFFAVVVPVPLVKDTCIIYAIGERFLSGTISRSLHGHIYRSPSP